MRVRVHVRVCACVNVRARMKVRACVREGMCFYACVLTWLLTCVIACMRTVLSGLGGGSVVLHAFGSAWSLCGRISGMLTKMRGVHGGVRVHTLLAMSVRRRACVRACVSVGAASR